MARLFLTLYIGVIGAIIAAFASLDIMAPRMSIKVMEKGVTGFAMSGVQLYQDIYVAAGEQQMLRSMERTAQLQNRVIVEVTDPQLLDSQKIMGLAAPGVLIEGEDESTSFYFRLRVNNKVYFNSPNTKSEQWRQERTLDHIYKFAFFMVTALVLGAWILVLHRKLKMLEKSALRISQGDFSARAPRAFKYQVGGLNNAFNLMAERIEELMASHKRLTSAISHELRTPIFRLRCQLELLEYTMADEEQQQYLTGMDDDLTELDDLIDAQLNYARIERVGVSLNLQSHSMPEWLNEHAHTLCRNCKKELLFKGEQKVIVSFDEKLMMRALNNLLRNADKYACTQIEMSYQVREDVIVICIDDDGDGIPMKDRERVFEPFERLDDARTRQSGGYGLGLSIVREIVQGHQGVLTIADSHLGGARLSIQLPLTEKQAHRPE